MIEKYIFDALLSRIKHGALKVNFWDNTSTTYGQGKPYFTVTIASPKVLRAMLRNLSLGFGEAYMDKQIEIDGPLGNVGRLSGENAHIFNRLNISRLTHRFNLNTRDSQSKHIQHHYDIGNDFYKLWLDKSLTYSGAYFHSAEDSLEQAQSQKVDHVLRKLQLEKGHSLLDIGSGWGTLLITAAKQYGVNGLGVTLAEQQWKHSLEAAKKAGVEKLVTFELVNYQELPSRNTVYDRIVSVGMFEHVGQRNQAQYYDAVSKMLRPGGISALHTITNQFERKSDPWIDKYIFPAGYIPTARQVVHELPKHDFHLIDYENLRMHYAMTLDEWLRRFEKHRAEVIKMYDERFYRMWGFYLANAASAFRYGDLSLSQYVFTRGLNNDLPLTREFLYK